jgi:hypothetical protein
VGDHVLIENFEDGSLELYNVRNDLSQKTDLARQMPDTVARLHGQLREWRRSVDAAMPRPNPAWRGK